MKLLSSVVKDTLYLLTILLISKSPLKISPSIDTDPEFKAAFSVAEILGIIPFIILKAWLDIILLIT